MKVAIKSSEIGTISLTDTIPEGFAEYHIPGSEIASFVAAFGKCMLQSAEFEGYGWVYSVFDIKEDVTLFVTYFIPLLIARISLTGNFDFEIKPFDNLVLRENQFNIFYLREATSVVHFAKGKHVLFEPFITQTKLWQTLNFFPAFEKFQQNILESRSSTITDRQHYLNASIAESIYKIIHSPFSESVRQFHVEIIKELFVKILKDVYEHEEPYNKKFSISEIERIYAAKEFIDSHVPEHFSIFQIARHAGINDQKLKTGFKEIFKTGLYSYLQKRILEIARIEIEQTKRSIKEIGFHAGYKNANNFSAAFRKKFGVKPLDWRKQYNTNSKR